MAHHMRCASGQRWAVRGSFRAAIADKSPPFAGCPLYSPCGLTHDPSTRRAAQHRFKAQAQKASMTEKNAIETYSAENRTFEPSPEFVAKSRLSSRAKYDELYRESIDSPDS